MGKLIGYYFAFIGLVFIIACAQVVAPTGGVRDKQHPIHTSIYPPMESTNFNDDEIIIDFDEFISLKGIKENLVVSPPLKYDLKTKVKGKTLEIGIKDTLLPNTTYVLNFGSAIVDITESNPIPDFKYVFSTGEHIDSLQVSGQLKDAFSLKVEEKVWVMLYKIPYNDSTPIVSLPSYLSKTNEHGEFSISNIKEGKYKIFALKDGNNNYLFDRPDEKVAFKLDTLLIDAPIDNLELFLFEHDNRKQYIVNQEDKNALLKLNFNLPIDSLNYTLLDTNLSDIIHWIETNEDNDSISFWWKEMESRKFKMAIHADTFFSDTIKFKIDSLPNNSNLSLITNLKSSLNYFEPIQLQFNRPIKRIDSSKITILNKDSIAIPFSIRLDTINRKSAVLNFQFAEDRFHQFNALPEAFTDVYELTNDSIKERLIINTEEDFGKLLINIHTNDSISPKIIQLILGKSKIIESYTTKNHVVFDHLNEGSYSLKMIIDKNSDGVWTTGHYLNTKQAEPVIILNEKIEIRKNWDKEIEWIIE